MRVHILAGALLLSGAGFAAYAQETEGTDRADRQELAEAAAAQAAAEAEDDSGEPDRGQEVVCRRERVTGSLTRVNRVCKTRDEWNGVYDATRDSLNATVRNAAGGAQCSQDQFGGC